MPFGPLKRYIRISPKKLLVMLGVSAVVVIAVVRYGSFFRRYVPLSKWQLLACLLGIVALVLAIRFLFRWRARAKARSLYQTLDEGHQQAAEVSSEEERARVQEIRERFQEAVRELHKHKKTIHDLPWFMLIGEPQSGKSMTLRGSELHFPIGTDKLSGLGGTRNCDWWFTNEAIILDTAGRLSFQQEGAPDRAEWEGFLELLAKKRRRCPINGVIVVIPADSLLGDAVACKDAAQNIHNKLGEMQQKLGVQFPVFLIITKCDLVLGFSEFFRSFGAVQAAQMLGWSNDAPFDQPYDPARFRGDFDAVYQRIAQRRLEIMRHPTDPEERGTAFSFPEEFKSLAGPLEQCLEIIFSPDIYHDSLFFRGFYFTSGMQEGTPIVKAVKGMLSGGRGGVDVEQEFNRLGELFPARPFFIADFYRKKALLEKGMVFRSSADIKRAKKLKRWTYVGGGIVSALLIVVLFWAGTKINSAIMAPNDHALQAARILKLDVLPMRKEMSTPLPAELLKHLDIDTGELIKNKWLWRVAFIASGVTEPVKYLKGIHDKLYLEEVLQKKIQVVRNYHKKNQGADGTASPKIRASLHEYVRWHLGYVPDEHSFDRFFDVPTLDQWEAEDQRFLAQHFEHFGENLGQNPRGKEWLRSAVSGTAEGTSDDVATAIGWAQDYYEHHIAGPRGEVLGSWVTLLDLCNAIQARYENLLALDRGFRDVKFIEDFDPLTAEWRQEYSRQPESDPQEYSLESAKEALIGLLGSGKITMTSTPIGGNGSNSKPEPDWPAIEDVKPEWYAFFGDSSSDGSSKIKGLQDVVDEAGLPKEKAIELTTRITQAVESLDDLAQKTIDARILAHKKKYLAVCDAAALSQNLKTVAKVLNDLDDALSHDKPIIGPNIEKWLEKRGEDATFVFEFDGEPLKNSVEEAAIGDIWSPDRLKSLIGAVGVAANRHRWYRELVKAETQLQAEDGQISSLDVFFPDWDKTVDAKLIGFDSIQQRHTKGKLRALTLKVEALRKRLEAVSDSGDSLWDKNGPAIADPAQRVREQVNLGLQSYYEEYFAAWARYYVDPEQRLKGYADLITTDDWSEYVVKLKEQHDELRNQARKQIKAIITHVLRVETSTGDSTSDAISEEHQGMIEVLREAESQAGGIFAGLSASLFDDGGEEKKGVAQRIVTEFDKFVTKVMSVNNLRAPSDTRVNLPAQTDGSAMDAFSKDRVTGQLKNIMLAGRYLLDKKLDDRLNDIIKTYFPDDDLIETFPFCLPADGPTPKEMPAKGFRRFLVEVAKKIEESTNALQVVGMCSGASTPNGRDVFANNCKKWRQFLYADEGSGLSAVNLKSPREIFFDIQYLRPRDHRSVGSKHYTTGELNFPMERSDYGGPRVAVQGRRTFKLNTSKYPPDGDAAKATWVFAKETAVTLTLSAPTSGSGLPTDHPVANVEIKKTAFALPMFIYRFCRVGGYEKIVPGRTEAPEPGCVWNVVIPIDLDGETSHAVVFRIALEDKEPLPPPIGDFESSTRQPAFSLDGPEAKHAELN